MHRKTTIAAAAILLVAVAGCSKSDPAPEATQSVAAAASEAPAAPWVAVVPAAGAYDATSADGKPFSKVTLEADGSYARVPASGAKEAGVVKITDGRLCFDPSGKANLPRCYTTTAPAADGSFTATDDKGVVLNVKPAA